MLTVHRKELDGQLKRLQEHLAKLDAKIDFYRQEIERLPQAPGSAKRLRLLISSTNLR